MKSRLYFLYIVATILICLSLFLVFSKKSITEDNSPKVEQDNKIDFTSKEKITLYDTQNGQIKEVGLDYYLFCVVASEIPFKYEIEAIKAQVIVARTYLFNKIISNGEEKADACTDFNHCQAYTELEKLEEIWKKKGFTDEEISQGKNKIKEAIDETDGKVITYNGQIIDAVFHASSPQKTEDARAIWTHKDIPYLQSVENVEDEDYERRETVVNVEYEDFKSTLGEENLTKEEFLNVSIGDYTDSGRVKNIVVGNKKISSEDLRKYFGLYSTNFTLDITENNIVFNVLGFGHGVGMSQVGANHYAKDGYTYDQIIHHYYTGVDIVDMKRGEL